MQSVAAEVITPRFRSLTEAQIDEKKPGRPRHRRRPRGRGADHQGAPRGLPRRRRARRGGLRHRARADRAVPRGRPRLHRRPGRRHQELRPRVQGPRGDDRRGHRRRDGPRLDLAARARDGLGGRARCRRTTKRRAGPSRARRRPAAGGHLDLVAPRPPAGRPADAGRHLGLLRRRLPQADGGRGRLRPLRPHQPVGPPARHPDGARGRRRGRPPRRPPLHGPFGRRRASWSPPTRPRSTSLSVACADLWPR